MKKILIIEAVFYQDISAMLLEGAKKRLDKSEYQYEIVTISGALEIPAVIAIAENTNQYAGYIGLGCVIRGETSHYDYVCTESARGLSELGFRNQLAIANGIITTENKEQAIARADMEQKNKGGFVANVCLEMIELKKRFS